MTWLMSVLSLCLVAMSEGPAPGGPAQAPALPENLSQNEPARGSSGRSEAGSGIGSKPVITRQTVFAIPFRIERPANAAQEPVEVQLYVSGDQGANWRLAARIDPKQGSFVFRSPGDGEFWFAVRTVDRSGQARPAWTGVPELRVIVDTVPPGLQFKAERGQGGQITARWEVTDPHLKPENMAIQFRAGTDRPWQTVALGTQNSQVIGPMQTGEVTWWPQASAGMVQIRAEVVDAAGNPSVSHAQVSLDTTPLRDPAAPPRGTPPSGTTPAPGVLAGPIAPDDSAPWRPASGLPTATGGTSPAPAGPRPRVVNNRLIELPYNDSAVGTAADKNVEGWGTRDGGKTWARVALDNERRSPVLVAVDGEGLYGFRVVAGDAADAAARAPRSGDPPDLWVDVDLTVPAARITGMRQAATERGTGLEISWEAVDRTLADRPVSIYFAPNPLGPWTPVATGLANTGRYVWPADGRVRGDVYLRLEVRDAAGNAAVCDAPQAVALDRLIPRAQIPGPQPGH